MSEFSDALQFLIVDGFVVKQIIRGGQVSSELLTDDDLFAASHRGAGGSDVRYFAPAGVTVAVIGESYQRAVSHCPSLLSALNRRLSDQADRTSQRRAWLYLRRTDTRVLALFVDLAERCGKMTVDGVVLDVPLTHQLVSDLIAIRRPSVTMTMAALESQGLLRRLSRARWWLSTSAFDMTDLAPD